MIHSISIYVRGIGNDSTNLHLNKKCCSIRESNPTPITTTHAASATGLLHLFFYKSHVLIYIRITIIKNYKTLYTRLVPGFRG